jgi:hypothetical protein
MIHVIVEAERNTRTAMVQENRISLRVGKLPALFMFVLLNIRVSFYTGWKKGL